MKQLNQKDPSQAKYYRQLKYLYRLFSKPEERLDFTTFKQWQNFQWGYLTENEVIARLLPISTELKQADE